MESGDDFLEIGFVVRRNITMAYQEVDQSYMEEVLIIRQHFLTKYYSPPAQFVLNIPARILVMTSARERIWGEFVSCFSADAGIAYLERLDFAVQGLGLKWRRVYAQRHTYLIQISEL